MLPRSEGGLLLSPSPSQDAIYSTSPLSEYSATVPDPGVIPLDANRRSTSASEALQYYWSSSAGERNGSVGSNLGMSPLDTTSASSNILTSPYSLSPHPLIPTHQSMSPILAPNKSELSLHALVEQEEQARSRDTPSSSYSDAPDEQGPYPGQLSDSRVTASLREPGTASAAGPSNRHIHLVSYPSDGSLSRVVDVPPSPSSSNSGESEYSVPEDSQANSSDLDRPRIHDAEIALRPVNRVSPLQRPRGLVDTEGRLDILLDPSFEEWAHQRAWDPPNTDDAQRRTSSAPISPSDATSPPNANASGDKWHSPLTGALLDRRRRASPIMRTPSPQHDRTPRNSSFSGRSDARTPTATMPKSVRSLFTSPADVSRRSSDLPERQISGLDLDATRGSRVGLSILGMGHINDPELPRSAPAHKTGFGDISMPETRRPTSLLPSVNVASPGHPSTHKLAPPGSDPLMNARRSPEPPPRSELRKPQTRTPTPPGPQIVTSPTSESPIHDNNNNNTSTTHSTLPRLETSGLRTQTLPTIINTPNTPVTSPQAPGRSTHVPSPRSHTAPLPSDKSRESSPQPASMTESGTIKNLTNILGGAIDEIGLIDSRDTPPPTIGVPAKQHGRTPLTLAQVPVRSMSSRANALPVHTPEQQFAQLSPTVPDFSQGTSPTSSLRSNVLATSPIGLGIMNTVGTVGASVAAAGGVASQRTGNVVRHVRKASSILSLRSSNYSIMSPTGSTFPAGNQLPQAIVYGNIKQLKSSGDRARAYAQFTAELQQATSGLREWLYQSQYQRPTNSRSTVKAGMAGLGLGMRPPPVGDTDSARNVSGGSEFPMRVDAYTARELSVRNLEPQDAPTALPSNLPYPQLQHQVHMKGSNSVQSLQSLNSLASYKAPPRGLGRAFNFLKREKENTSLAALGPINPTSFSAMGPPASAKRELRSMPISSPHTGRSSLDSAEPRVQPSLAVPRGPRDVPGRERHSHDGRSSLDSGRWSGPRASPGLGGPRDPPHGASPLSQRDHNAPSDEEVRAMAEMLPHGERAVIRAYLQQYGEPSYAVSAYIEDEKNGTLMRV